MLLSLALLTAAVLVVFGRTVAFGFLDYDDAEIVSAHPVVSQGLTPETAVWAFTHFHFAIWMPLTTLSHLLDVTLFGTAPAGHHAMSIAWHLAGVFALFFAARRLLGGTPAALTAALLYAVHPLRAEAVAWVASRKDLTAALFAFLCLWAYAGYAARPSPRRYLSALAFFALALMGKPSAMPLPAALLLFDAVLWRRRGMGVLLEKAPFFLLSAASALLSWKGQAAAGALVGPDAAPLAHRLLNVPVVLVVYLRAWFLPVGLSPHCPVETVQWSALGMALAWGGVLALTAAALLLRRHRWPLAAWGFFVLMLAPVLGLVPFSNAPVADRYTGLASAGPALLAGWALVRCPGCRSRTAQRTGALLTAGIIAALEVLCFHQTGFWRNDETVFRRVLAVHPDDDLGHANLGTLFFERGDLDRALHHHRRAVEIRPGFAPWRYNLGSVLLETGPASEAAAQLAEAVRLNPDDIQARTNLGLAYMGLGNLEAALRELAASVEGNPADVNARINYGLCLFRAGKSAEAVPHLEEALRLDPGNPAARANLDLARRAGASSSAP